jgi:hypothetical protein
MGGQEAREALDWRRTYTHVHADRDALASRVSELEQALRASADYIEAEYREGDKPYQVAIIARTALAGSPAEKQEGGET